MMDNEMKNKVWFISTYTLPKGVQVGVNQNRRK